MNKQIKSIGITGQDGSYLAEFLLEKAMKFMVLKEGLVALPKNRSSIPRPTLKDPKFICITEILQIQVI